MSDAVVRGRRARPQAKCGSGGVCGGGAGLGTPSVQGFPLVYVNPS